MKVIKKQKTTGLMAMKNRWMGDLDDEYETQSFGYKAYCEELSDCIDEYEGYYEGYTGLDRLSYQCKNLTTRDELLQLIETLGRGREFSKVLKCTESSLFNEAVYIKLLDKNTDTLREMNQLEITQGLVDHYAKTASSFSFENLSAIPQDLYTESLGVAVAKAAPQFIKVVPKAIQTREMAVEVIKKFPAQINHLHRDLLVCEDYLKWYEIKGFRNRNNFYPDYEGVCSDPVCRKTWRRITEYVLKNDNSISQEKLAELMNGRILPQLELDFYKHDRLSHQAIDDFDQMFELLQSYNEYIKGVNPFKAMFEAYLIIRENSLEQESVYLDKQIRGLLASSSLTPEEQGELLKVVQADVCPDKPKKRFSQVTEHSL